MGWRRLSGIDAIFLYAERERSPLHVVGAIELEGRSGRPGEDFERLRAQIARRAPALPVLRRRLVEVPFGLDRPVWADDPRFDLSAHLHRAALPAPGGRRELAACIARIAEQPLRRDRPLWELHAVEGLRGGRIALVVKIHHAAVDGVGAVKLLAALLGIGEAEPGASEAAAAPPPDEPAPSPLDLLLGAALSLGGAPLRGARELWNARGLGGRLLDSALGRDALVRWAPRTRLNGRVSSRRAVALGSVPICDVLDVKNAFAATVNHVVLAACAGALRRYLGDRGELPREPLIAAIPMATGRCADDGAGNALSVMLVRLPVHLADALDRLHAAREASREARRRHEAFGDPLGGWPDLLSPALLSGLSRAYDALGLAERHPPVHNVVISNVPGPEQPLTCAGARVAACHPLGPIYDGWALNLTVLSYAGSIGIGAIACPEAVPDLERIPRAFEASVAQLVRLARGEKKRLTAAARRARS